MIMAFDKNDKADQKILADAIAEALEEAATEHEAEIAGLKTKNVELIGKLKKAREGGNDPAEVEKLEAKLEAQTKELSEAQKALKAATKERDTFKAASETESAAARKLLVDGGLTENLVAAGVKKEFLPAVKKLLADQVTVKVEGDNRSAVVGDKSLSDFVKVWSQGDEGKNYIVAPANGGGNAPGGKATPTNQDLAKLPPVERINAARAAGAK